MRRGPVDTIADTRRIAARRGRVQQLRADILHGSLDLRYLDILADPVDRR